MGTEHVASATVLGLLRLFSGAHEIGRDQTARGKFLFDGFARLLGVDAYASGTVGEFAAHDGRALVMKIGLTEGWDATSDALLQRYINDGLAFDPVLAHTQALAVASPQFAARREDLIDNRAWYEMPYVADFRRSVGLDHTLVCGHVVDARGTAEGVLFHRAFGSRPFSVEDRVVARLFFEEQSRLLQQDRALPVHLQAPYERLSRRQREALGLLLSGKSYKEISAAMGLSWHTVHDYVRTSYVTFGVSGRAELQALLGPYAL